MSIIFEFYIGGSAQDLQDFTNLFFVYEKDRAVRLPTINSTVLEIELNDGRVPEFDGGFNFPLIGNGEFSEISIQDKKCNAILQRSPKSESYIIFGSFSISSGAIFPAISATILAHPHLEFSFSSFDEDSDESGNIDGYGGKIRKNFRFEETASFYFDENSKVVYH